MNRFVGEEQKKFQILCDLKVELFSIMVLKRLRCAS
jgi:hypothetical protein